MMPTMIKKNDFNWLSTYFYVTAQPFHLFLSLFSKNLHHPHPPSPPLLLHLHLSRLTPDLVLTTLPPPPPPAPLPSSYLPTTSSESSLPSLSFLHLTSPTSPTLPDLTPTTPTAPLVSLLWNMFARGLGKKVACGERRSTALPFAHAVRARRGARLIAPSSNCPTATHVVVLTPPLHPLLS